MCLYRIATSFSRIFYDSYVTNLTDRRDVAHAFRDKAARFLVMWLSLNSKDFPQSL